jgi:hypothetical protein
MATGPPQSAERHPSFSGKTRKSGQIIRVVQLCWASGKKKRTVNASMGSGLRERERELFRVSARLIGLFFVFPNIGLHLDIHVQPTTDIFSRKILSSFYKFFII